MMLVIFPRPGIRHDRSETPDHKVPNFLGGFSYDFSLLSLSSNFPTRWTTRFAAAMHPVPIFTISRDL